MTADECYTFSKPEKLIEIGKKAVDCLEDALKQWSDTFGTNMHDAWVDSDRVIQDIVTQVREILNGRFG